MGLLDIIASSTVLGIPSNRDVNTNTAHPAIIRSASGFGTHGTISMRPSRPSSPMSRRTRRSSGPANPAPAITNRTSGRAAVTRAAIRTNNSGFF